ncbi:MAG: ATP-binding protein [Nonlabens sp.]|uniref:sensor histidine kinase n=1 Tax=Nonlabens sp. TaxID=1888209 RepID=UPI003EF4D4CC
MKFSFRELTLISVWITCIFSSTNLIAQGKVYHEVFTSRDGLVIDNIQDIIQDKNGFLWVAGNTLDNREIISKPSLVTLQRFDGKNFHNINPDFKSKYTYISKLLKYSDSNFVVHSKNVESNHILTTFNTSTCIFADLEPKGFDNVSDIRFIDGKYYLLNAIGTTVQVWLRDDRGEWIELFSFKNDVTSIEVDRNSIFLSVGDYYIFSDNNFPITITDKQGQLIKKFSYSGFNRERDLVAKKIWIEEAFVFNDSLYAFMNNDDVLYVFDEKELDFIPFNVTYFNGKKNIKTFVDSNGKVLIASNKENTLQLTTLNDQGLIVPIFNHNFKDVASIQLWSRDIKNELWLAAGGNIHYYRFPNSQFDKYLMQEQLRAIKHIGDQDYIIATENGGWFKYNHEFKKIKPFPLYEKEVPIKLESSRNIFVEKDTLWTQTMGYIVAINKNNGDAKSYRHYPSQCIEQLNDSTLVYGTRQYHLMAFNKKSRTHESIVKTDSLNILDIAVDKDRNWIVSATTTGVFVYDINTKENRFYQNELQDSYLLVADYYEKYGFLLGSRNGIVTRFDPREETFEVIYRDNLKAGIATITPYEEDLWLNTFNGLVHYNPQNEVSVRYSVKDGLSHKEGNRYSASRTSDGILLGSLVGLNHFIPEQLIAQESSDSLQFLKIRTFDPDLNKFKDLFDKSAFAKAKNISLPVENKLLELDFSLTGLDVLRNESYEYKLNNEDWISLGEIKKLQFLNLAAGNYNLKVRAKDFSGTLIGKPLEIDIVSEDFFYNKWWFYALIGLLSITVFFYFLYQERIKSLMQVKFSQDLLQNQEKERSRIAKELHDSVGQQLTLIKQKAQSQELDSIAELTNTTLEEVRSISRNLYPVIIKQLGLKGAIEHLLLQIDEETDLFVSVIVDDIDDLFNIEESVNIYRFIQECVSNVLKHAAATTIDISIDKKKDNVVMEIRDNGTGFKVTEKEGNNSLGLKTLKERIRILNGLLSIESEPNKGSFITATIPLK